MITKKPTKDMSREEWLAERRKSIGGSDAACILGLNPYNSAYSLWCEKTGKVVPEDVSDRESVRLGNDLEQYVAERWMEETGKKVRRENSIIYNSDYPFAHANPDRMVVGESAGLECKTTSSWELTQKLRSGEIPDYWLCQVTHYMMVTGAERWYLGALAFGAGFYSFTIERDDAEISALASAESVFWGKVTNHTPPVLDGSRSTTEALGAIYPASLPGAAVDLSMVGAHVETLNALTRQIAELESLKAEQENLIKDFMGRAESGTYGDTRISWKTTTRKIFDKTAWEAANGKIADRYYKTTESRTFRVTKN